ASRDVRRVPDDRGDRAVPRANDRSRMQKWRCVTATAVIFPEPISKSPEEDKEAGELYEAEEVPGVVFPTDEDAALPLNPSKEALHEPASHIAAQPSPILRGRLASVAAMRRDHLDAVLAQLLIEWIAIVGAIANQILRL